MKGLKFAILAVFIAMFLGGCIAKKSPTSAQSSSSEQNLKSAKISEATLKKLASDSTKKLLASKKISKQKNRFAIVGISEISCEKKCDFNTDFLRKKLKVGLIHSGKVVVIDAPSSDELVFSNDGLKKSDASHANSIYSPDFLLLPSVKFSGEKNGIFEVSLKDAEKKSEIWSYKNKF
ncbi:hypothetical protein OFO07_04265 [Campylobacter sp. JMF_06 NA1]|uniref:hypothetical protein n=1 Tax=Campylobacter sp. JMF_06 NA1 TaxID=2983823 RepID=UPI0022E9D8F6|nr:hypothetical protein [Campylobacter sp. JMF_06 NA1]MDA3078140.1 hypothetical protein [Campylobacter sp. JMF_06 NA1]